MAMEVQANYIGPKGDGGYWVNVKTAHPKGRIGDAGFIRKFNTEEEAKIYTDIVNTTGQDVFVKQKQDDLASGPHAGDTFEAKKLDDETRVECPKASWFQAITQRLSDEQVEIINKTGKLPDGVKVIRNTNTGDFMLCPDFNVFTPGTKTIPAGYELKQSIGGVTLVVPQDTESIFIKNAS